MQFLYHKNAGEKELYLEDEAFLHLKARRIKLKEKLYLRNLQDSYLYSYELVQINKKNMKIQLLKTQNSKPTKSAISLALSIIEPKILEKILSFLNELNLEKLILVYADFSQKNFKINTQRLERILIQSCQQCGRKDLMQINIIENSKNLAQKYENIILVDFQGLDFKKASKQINFKEKIPFIGPEGGFSAEERALFKEKLQLPCPNILKTQTAIISLAALLLLN